jgi:hypothetical protein
MPQGRRAGHSDHNPGLAADNGRDGKTTQRLPMRSNK